jgi:transposase
MTAIGIDTHKATLTACAVDGLGLALAERTFRNDPAGHRALEVWATEVAAGGLIGIEGSSTYGAALARFLVAAGFAVREVPPQLTRRSRTESRRPGKTDPGDSQAHIAILEGVMRHAGRPWRDRHARHRLFVGRVRSR